MNRYAFNEQDHIPALDGKPLMGTSTVVGVLSKPLTWWAAGEAVKKLGSSTDFNYALKKAQKKGAKITSSDDGKITVK